MLKQTSYIFYLKTFLSFSRYRNRPKNVTARQSHMTHSLRDPSPKFTLCNMKFKVIHFMTADHRLPCSSKVQLKSHFIIFAVKSNVEFIVSSFIIIIIIKM